MKITALFPILAFGLATPVLAQDAAPSAPPAPAAAAPAAQAATAKAGDTIYDSQGQVVGTVESVAGDNFVLSTGTSKATLPLSALGSSPQGATIAMTKTQLEAAIAQASGK